MNIQTADPLQYAGFWPRLCAVFMDCLIFLPLTALGWWANHRYRLFDLYSFVPYTLIYLFYSVYLVRRFGGTPGKLIVGIRIRKVSGKPVGYREAVLRYLPEGVLGLLMSIAMVIARFHMSDWEYQALSSHERAKRVLELAPFWYNPLLIWFCVQIVGEVIVLLTNRKKRALHDFIAGTVVIRTSPDKTLLEQPLG